MTELTIAPGKTRIGWIGTGVMGSSMVGHLITKGYTATVFNRSRDKAKPLLDRGAKWGASPKAVAQESDVTFSIVGFPHDVREVILGPGEWPASMPRCRVETSGPARRGFPSW